MLRTALLIVSLVQQPDTVRLPEVVTTATRLGPGAGTVTTSHTVLTGAELRERGIILLVDALRDVPGMALVQAGSYGAATSLFLRGGESDYVKVLVDGVPMNAPGGAFNLANLTTDNLERIEIIRGPASVLYGADAVAGVIQVFTRQGAGPLSHAVSLEAGGRGARRVGGSVAGAGRAGSLAVEAGSLGSDGLYAFNSAYRNSGISARLALPADAPIEASATVRYGDRRANFPTGSGGVPSDSNQYTTERQLALGIDLSRAIGRGAVLRARGGWSRTDDGFRNRLDHPADTVGFGFQAARDGRVDRSGIDLQLVTAASGWLAGAVGVHYEDERQRQSGSTTSNFGTGIATDLDTFRAARSTRALYTEAALSPSGRLTLTGGGRLDDNSAFGTFVTWRLGGSLRPREGLTLRGQVGRAFKAPTFPELFARSPFEVGDPGLTPERATSWEVGVDQLLADGRVQLSAAWFDQRFRDLIQYASAEPGEPTYGNVAAATARGIELGVVLVPAHRLRLSATATALRTRVTDDGGNVSPAFQEGERLVRRPAFSAALAGRWQATARLLLRVDVHHLGPRADVDYRGFPSERVELPGRTTADLAVTTLLPVAGPEVAVTGRIENLFDTRWEQAVGFPGRGRLAFIGLRVGR